MITAMEARKPTVGSGLVESETVEDGASGREDTEATLTPLHRGVAPCAATALPGFTQICSSALGAAHGRPLEPGLRALLVGRG